MLTMCRPTHMLRAFTLGCPTAPLASPWIQVLQVSHILEGFDLASSPLTASSLPQPLRGLVLSEEQSRQTFWVLFDSFQCRFFFFRFECQTSASDTFHKNLERRVRHSPEAERPRACNCESELREIKSGVPQGSIPGPFTSQSLSNTSFL